MDDNNCGAISGRNEWQGKPKYSEETCPSVALSTTDPSRLNPGSNLSSGGGKPAINRLRYGTTLCRTCYNADRVQEEYKENRTCYT
jgi:hypothetical protein